MSEFAATEYFRWLSDSGVWKHMPLNDARSMAISVDVDRESSSVGEDPRIEAKQHVLREMEAFTPDRAREGKAGITMAPSGYLVKA